VVSLGGGAVLHEANRVALRALGTVVWLRARPESLAARVGEGRGRPLLAAAASRHPEGVLGLMKVMCEERSGLYASLADVVVDVDAMTARDVAGAVVTAVLQRAAPGTGPGGSEERA